MNGHRHGNAEESETCVLPKSHTSRKWRDSSRCHSPKLCKGIKSRPVTMLQARPHAINFNRILDFEMTNTVEKFCNIVTRTRTYGLVEFWRTTRMSQGFCGRSHS